MGACASVSRRSIRLTRRRSKADRHIVRPESPIKISEPPPVDLTVNCLDYSDAKDETFFETSAWLDSDCDDDFYSVRGDFTPSRGNTPVHHLFSIAKPLVKDPMVEVSDTPTMVEVSDTCRSQSPTAIVSEVSPTSKKSLSELLRDTAEEDEKDAEVASLSGNRRGDAKSEENGEIPLFGRTETVESARCCMPKFVSYRSFNDRKRMSPASTVSVNG